MKKVRKHYQESFKRQVLDDYYASKVTQQACADKWGISRDSLHSWLRSCTNEKNVVPLRRKTKLMDAKDQALENMRVENERLRRDLEYQKLKVAGYERLLEIIKEEDGIDLLKKDGAKQ